MSSAQNSSTREEKTLLKCPCSSRTNSSLSSHSFRGFNTVMSNLLCRRSGVSGQLLLTRHARILVNACLTQKSLPKFVGEKNVTYEFAPLFFWAQPTRRIRSSIAIGSISGFPRTSLFDPPANVLEKRVWLHPLRTSMSWLSCEIDLFMARSQAR